MNNNIQFIVYTTHHYHYHLKSCHSYLRYVTSLSLLCLKHCDLDVTSPHRAIFILPWLGTSWRGKTMIFYPDLLLLTVLFQVFCPQLALIDEFLDVLTTNCRIISQERRSPVFHSLIRNASALVFGRNS